MADCANEVVRMQLIWNELLPQKSAEIDYILTQLLHLICTTLVTLLYTMRRDPYQNICSQPGIDWTKAARLAMNPDADLEDEDYLGFEYQEALPKPTIKYPLPVGKHLNRDPERDSFLRGGTQFKSLQHNPKSGYAECDLH